MLKRFTDSFSKLAHSALVQTVGWFIGLAAGALLCIAAATVALDTWLHLNFVFGVIASGTVLFCSGATLLWCAREAKASVPVAAKSFAAAEDFPGMAATVSPRPALNAIYAVAYGPGLKHLYRDILEYQHNNREVLHVKIVA